MHLTRAHIQNYRCFADVDVPLRPLTVCIGDNNTGKSTFLSALTQVRLNKWGSPQEIDLGGGARLTLALSDHATVWPRSQRMVQLPAAGPSMVSPGVDGHQVPHLAGNGDGVPQFLDHLLRRDRAGFFALVDAFKSAIPGLEDVEIATPEAASRRLDLRLEDGLVLPADQASTGARIILFYLALAHHPEPPELLLIEEPETGVHPRRLGHIVSLLRSLTKPSPRRPSGCQIVLTTHSPYLLDAVDPEQDQVLVFRREDDGRRTVAPVDAERIRPFLDEFQMGEIWFNEQEAGLVG